MITAVIIDDEEISLQALDKKIAVNCAGIKVLALFSKPEEALEAMPRLKPDVVFLDIEMPKMNAFTFLQHCENLHFEVVFTTAYSQYAIEALRISALDFLLKPIDTKELEAAAVRLEQKLLQKKMNPGTLQQQLELFFQYQQQAQPLSKVALPVLNGLEFIELSSIVKVEAANVYANFYLSNGKTILVSRTLKEVEKMLPPQQFMRVHKSFIVNLNYINQYIKGEGGTVILSDGSEVEISRRSKNDFLARFGK